MSESYLARISREVAHESRSARYGEGVPAERTGRPRSLRAAVDEERQRGALLVEYKRASPSAATPLPAPRSVDDFLRATAVPGVAAYSCLATRSGFDGAPARVAELAGRTDRPVLFKEFVLHDRQLDVAARSGAAAVLLIARLAAAGLLEQPLADLASAAHARGLEVLLELHDSAELSQADGVAADVYGVNTRDLDTLRLDRPRAFDTLARAREAGLRPLLGLSGVESAADAEAFWSRGCDGLLVGSAVARAPDPATFLRSLRRADGSRR